MTDHSRDPARDLNSGPAGDRHNVTEQQERGSIPPPSVGRGRVRHNRAVGWRSRDVVRGAALVFAMYLTLKLLWFASVLFLTLFLGVLFGVAVSAGVDHLQRLRIPRGVGAALIVISFYGLLGGFGAWMAPTLRAQGTELRQKLPEAVDRVQRWLDKRQSGVIGIVVGGGSASADSAHPATAAAAAPASVSSATSATPAPQGRDTVASKPGENVRARIQSQMGGVSKYLFPFLHTTLEAVAGVLLITFLSIYFAADPDLYRRGALLLLPPRRRAQGAEVMARVATVLRKWLVTQLIAMAAIGTVSTIALLILHVKAAFALGLLAGLFEFIPTVGPLLSAVPAIGMGFLDSPEKALAIGAVYVGIQFLENHILIPLLMKGGMDLPPALTVLAQALLAIVFGFMGLMVAVPLLATVMTVVQVLYVERHPDDDTPARRGSSDRFDPDLDEQIGPGIAPA